MKSSALCLSANRIHHLDLSLGFCPYGRAAQSFENDSLEYCQMHAFSHHSLLRTLYSICADNEPSKIQVARECKFNSTSTTGRFPSISSLTKTHRSDSRSDGNKSPPRKPRRSDSISVLRTLNRNMRSLTGMLACFSPRS